MYDIGKYVLWYFIPYDVLDNKCGFSLYRFDFAGRVAFITLE